MKNIHLYLLLSLSIIIIASSLNKKQNQEKKHIINSYLNTSDWIQKNLNITIPQEVINTSSLKDENFKTPISEPFKLDIKTLPINTTNKKVVPSQNGIYIDLSDDQINKIVFITNENIIISTSSLLAEKGSSIIYYIKTKETVNLDNSIVLGIKNENQLNISKGYFTDEEYIIQKGIYFIKDRAYKFN